MHFQVPCFGVMDDLTDIVHWALDGTTPPWGSGSSTSMGSGLEGLWFPGSKNVLGCRGVVASRASGPESASGSWNAVALLVLPWNSGAEDASESWDPTATPTLGLSAGFGY
jgi:hypothetical protein